MRCSRQESWKIRLGFPAVVFREISASIASRIVSISSAVARKAAQPATLTSISLRTSKSCLIDVCAARPARSVAVPGRCLDSRSATMLRARNG